MVDGWWSMGDGRWGIGEFSIGRAAAFARAVVLPGLGKGHGPAGKRERAAGGAVIALAGISDVDDGLRAGRRALMEDEPGGGGG